LCEEFEDEKKKEQNFLTFRSRDLNPRFMIWIFMESVEPEIKSKQASKRDRTLFEPDPILTGYYAKIGTPACCSAVATFYRTKHLSLF
jgi:hypothetical protein